MCRCEVPGQLTMRTAIQEGFALPGPADGGNRTGVQRRRRRWRATPYPLFSVLLKAWAYPGLCAPRRDADAGTRTWWNASYLAVRSDVA